MRSSITINTESDEFFIAIAKKTSDLHSFVVVGVIQNNIPIMLAKAGKHGGEHGVHFFSESVNHIYNHDISYTAYSISVHQYKQFIDLLSSAIQQPGRASKCYIPSTIEEPSPLMRVTFHYPKYATAPMPSQTHLLERASYLTPTNTCRHAAIDTIEYIQETNEATQHLSHFFFMDLLLENHFPKQDEDSSTTPTRPFYILPAPPHAHSVGIETKAVLTKLYHRMHHLLKKDPYSECTQNKFNALKRLYQTLSSQPNDDLNLLLVSIQEWKNEHRASISPLRQQGLFGQILNQFNITYKSSTETLADEIEKTVSIKAARG
jgi:hypothetical protein